VHRQQPGDEDEGAPARRVRVREAKTEPFTVKDHRGEREATRTLPSSRAVAPWHLPHSLCAVCIPYPGCTLDRPYSTVCAEGLVLRVCSARAHPGRQERPFPPWLGWGLGEGLLREA